MTTLVFLWVSQSLLGIDGHQQNRECFIVLDPCSFTVQHHAAVAGDTPPERQFGMEGGRGNGQAPRGKKTKGNNKLETVCGYTEDTIFFHHHHTYKQRRKVRGQRDLHTNNCTRTTIAIFFLLTRGHFLFFFSFSSSSLPLCLWMQHSGEGRKEQHACTSQRAGAWEPGLPQG